MILELSVCLCWGGYALLCVLLLPLFHHQILPANQLRSHPQRPRTWHSQRKCVNKQSAEYRITVRGKIGPKGDQISTKRRDPYKGPVMRHSTEGPSLTDPTEEPALKNPAKTTLD